MLVARSPPPPLGVSVAKHRAPVLQTCGLVRASSDTSKNFRFEVETCSWKTVIGASCPPAPQSYRCHVILTEPRGSANQIMTFSFLANFEGKMLLSKGRWTGCALSTRFSEPPARRKVRRRLSKRSSSSENAQRSRKSKYTQPLLL